LAAEVIDLGQTLFDSVLECVASAGDVEECLAMDSEEARSAAGEFFTALRLLLGLEEER